MKSATSAKEVVRHALATKDDDMRWKLVMGLHRRGDKEVLQEAIKLCQGESPTERILGADILGQLGAPLFEFRDESLRTLSEMTSTEKEPKVLSAVASALGHLDDERAIEPLLALKGHADAEVRSSVASALPSAMANNENPAGIAALIELMRDKDERVRHWATFGLSMQLETDTPEVRTALLSRLVGPTREMEPQALIGLARRKDDRVLEPLLEALQSVGAREVWDRYQIVDAARELGDPRSYSALRDVQDEGLLDDYPDLLRDAIAECQPQ